MSFIPDLSSLDSAATTLESHADELRSRVTRLTIAIAVVNWSSDAASAFRQHTDDVFGQLQQCADLIDTAAAALRRHAATARGRLDVLAAAAHGVADGAADVADVATDAIAGGVSDLRRLGGWL